MRREFKTDVFLTWGILYERTNLPPFAHRPTVLSDLLSCEVALKPSPGSVPERVKKRRDLWTGAPNG
jgi:hypothetical protein